VKLVSDIRASDLMPFVDIVDEQRAAEYVKGELSGGTTLAKLVASSIDLSRGRYRVAMPETQDQLKEFNLRWETFRLTGDEEVLFGRVIKTFVRIPECAVILQDTLKSISDAYMPDMPYRALAIPYQKEVYWTVTGSEMAELSDDAMGDLINHASFWPFSAFFYIEGISRAKSELNDGDLQLIVNRLVGLAVGAFDDRSYLVWWRDDVRPFPLG
jgi:hypothetical protein